MEEVEEKDFFKRKCSTIWSKWPLPDIFTGSGKRVQNDQAIWGYFHSFSPLQLSSTPLKPPWGPTTSVPSSKSTFNPWSFLTFQTPPLPLCYTSVQFSCSVMSSPLRPHELQHARLPCSSPTPKAWSNSCSLSRWCHPTLLSSVVPFSCLNLSQHQGLFKWVSSSHQVAKVLEHWLQHQSFQWIFRMMDWFDLLAVPRNSQENC